jgi:hypothetical protein
MVPVSTWVDDLKRMQRGVDDLQKQHCKAKACDKPIALPAKEYMQPGSA